MRRKASARATKEPVTAAVRVPPSAWMTSQSSQMVRSPMAAKSTTLRRERPMRRWISRLRALTRLRDSLAERTSVERGSMAYSAVTQPSPQPLRKGGTFSSRVAVQRTMVSPMVIRAEPSGYFR